MKKTGFVILDQSIKSESSVLWIALTYRGAEAWIDKMVECGAWNRKDLVIGGVGIVDEKEK